MKIESIKAMANALMNCNINFRIKNQLGEISMKIVSDAVEKFSSIKFYELKYLI